MATVVVGSAVGAPGATLSSLALAGVWATVSNRRAVLVEANPDGGVLAIRYRLSRSPGLVELAAATRQTNVPDTLDGFSQELPGGLRVVVGPESPRQAASALSTGGSGLADLLNRVDVDVVVDAGRMHGLSRPVAVRGDLVLMAVRPIAEHLYPARERLETLRREGANAQWLLVGEGPYGPADIVDGFGLPVAGVIVHDPRGAALLETGGSSKRLDRSPLIRSVRTLVDELRAPSGPLAALPAIPDPGNGPVPPPPPPPSGDPVLLPPPSEPQSVLGEVQP